MHTMNLTFSLVDSEEGQVHHEADIGDGGQRVMPGKP
jgi:hypothetical protein